VATGGRIFRAIFVAVANVRRVHPSDWARVGIVLLAIIGRMIGVILVLSAAGLARIQNLPGRAPAIIAALGTLVIALLTGLQLDVLFDHSNAKLAILVIGTMATGCVMILLGSRFWRRAMTIGMLDRALWLTTAAEIIAVVLLCRASTGAWVNYAIQAGVFGCVLAARALDRAVADISSARAFLAIMLATLAVVAGPVYFVYPEIMQRQLERKAKELIFDHMKRPPHEFFFVDRPGVNRLDGRFDLIYDNWLYPVFESARLAEPRSVWLLLRLTDGSVRFVVNTSDSVQIPGIGGTLTELGFVRRIHVGPYYVWERDPATAYRYLGNRNQ
jgi:hypothetical protein